ncbi:MAG: tetraacyldisaccharide 4'-kinase [Deltaproteobacteria bacterium]|nr:tetraacyldisaccharide 4'-kinase [Deltaproteobacteria bacterium]
MIRKLLGRGLEPMLGARRAWYRHGPGRVHEVDGLRVIAVGGALLGGSGKTPCTESLARALSESGERVAIVLRGYKSRYESAGAVVSDGTRVLLDADGAGDEAAMLARLLPKVPVVIGADRVAAAARARALGASTVVADGAFDACELARDVEILVLDRDGGDLAESAAPFGPRRLALKDVARADLRVYVGDGRVPPGAVEPSLGARIVARGLVGLDLDRSAARPVSGLNGRRVALLTGIARPRRVKAFVQSLGGVVVLHRSAGDHHRFGAIELAAFAASSRIAGADVLVTTAKDARRLVPHESALGDMDVAVLDVALAIEGGWPGWLLHPTSVRAARA